MVRKSVIEVTHLRDTRLPISGFDSSSAVGILGNILNEQHLKRLMSEYVRYYHEDRTYLGLAKDAPTGLP
jgi:hypothetical protein